MPTIILTSTPYKDLRRYDFNETERVRLLLAEFHNELDILAGTVRTHKLMIITLLRICLSSEHSGLPLLNDKHFGGVTKRESTEGKGHNTVATIRRQERKCVGRCPFLRVRNVESIVIVGIPLTDGVVYCHRIGWQLFQYQRNNTITTIDACPLITVCATRTYIEPVLIVCFSWAEHIPDSVVVGRKHLQHERHQAIRTRSTPQLLRIGACGAFVKTILLVGGA